jgi:hypothetical protein
VTEVTDKRPAAAQWPMLVRANRIAGGDWLIEIDGWGRARCDERVVGSILDEAADALFGPAPDD